MAASPNLVDALFCEEEDLEEEEEDLEEEEEEDGVLDGEESYNNSSVITCSSLSSNDPSVLLLEQDLFWEDEELVLLFCKEEEADGVIKYVESDSQLWLARRDCIEWMMRVNAHYGFSALTCVLCVNYLDRFISSKCFERDKPWMTQLAAVACLSLAAKVEEIQVPLLLDLQVEESKYVFEAKTIQRMELLVLSTLDWKMNPVTALSFVDHIIRRLGLKTRIHWEFMRLCERLLVSVIGDSRSVCYLPSVLATSAMLHVINEMELYNPIEYQNQLLGILNINKDKVEECYEFILLNRQQKCKNNNKGGKRKYEEEESSLMSNSPNGVIDALFSYDSSNDSWVASSSSSLLFKKRRQQQQQQQQKMLFPALITSPR